MIVVIKDLYTLKSWEDQDTESLAFHLNNKKIWDNCRDGLPYPYTKGNARFFIKQAQEKTDISDFVLRLVARLLVTLVCERYGRRAFQCGSGLLD